MPCPSSYSVQLRNSLAPGQRGNCPILHYSFLSASFTQVPPSWTLEPASPSPAPQPVHSCVGGPEAWATRWVGEHLACSVHDPRWPCRCCTESFPPPLSVVLLPQGPPKPIWRPQGPRCQQFSQSLSPEQIVWELCQF